MWDCEYAPGITCGHAWCLLNGGKAEKIEGQTQRAKKSHISTKIPYKQSSFGKDH